MQFTPIVTKDFGTNAIADSMRLFLRYESDSTIPIYGDITRTNDF